MVLGVIGLFAPILQGWLFIIAGLSVMAPESPAAHRTLEWLKARLPHRKHRQTEQTTQSADGPRPSRAEREQQAERSSGGGARRLGRNEREREGGYG
jgi:hypothetical protein